MIDTKKLKEGDICIVELETSEKVLCIFTNGLFQNIEEKHTYEVYGSSVFGYKKIQTTSNLITILSDIKRILVSKESQNGGL